MENLSEIIKKTRESKNLTLEDVSESTKIRVNVLKAIESGNFDYLSKVYMYFFLKEYIKYLGLNIEDYKDQIDKIFKKETIKEETLNEDLSSLNLLQKKRKIKYTARQLNKALYFIYVAIFLSFVAIIYFTFFYEAEEQKPIEVLKSPDTLVIKENKPLSNIIQETQDSIKLEFIATDTVWINMVIDNKTSEKLLLYPNNSKVWYAANFFKFTLGNAGGVIIRRNGEELPKLSKEKVAIKNIVVTRDKFYIEQVPKPKPTTEGTKTPVIISPSEIKKELPALRDTKKTIIK
jgi:cytoskeletal protein RodZ